MTQGMRAPGCKALLGLGSRVQGFMRREVSTIFCNHGVVPIYILRVADGALDSHAIQRGCREVQRYALHRSYGQVRGCLPNSG